MTTLKIIEEFSFDKFFEEIFKDIFKNNSFNKKHEIFAKQVFDHLNELSEDLMKIFTKDSIIEYLYEWDILTKEEFEEYRQHASEYYSSDNLYFVHII